MRDWLQRRWYSDAPPPPLLLRPLAALFGRIAAARRRRLQSAARELPVAVIVVGNITVGGAGKTPVVAWLVEQLRALGRRPGVVSRGYGGNAASWPQDVRPDSDPREVGDEPALLARRLRCPVAAAPDRLAAAQLLIAQGVDVIVSDDGLQHYALARDLEIVVVDGERGLGNGALLPAGPLREPATRLREAHFIVVNGGTWSSGRANELRMRLVPGEAVRLDDGRTHALADFRHGPVHAVAGIGHPARFFRMLQEFGLQVIPHAFADHHVFAPAELEFPGDAPVLMTEKDAVKCARFSSARLWAVPVTAAFDAAAAARVQESLRALRRPQLQF